MSDPRFARLKSDPRFRKPKKHQFKVTVDDRFKGVFDDDKKGKKKSRSNARVDKYGRTLSDSHEKDNLRRFYRLENEEEEQLRAGPDHARGEGLIESSDEEEDVQPAEDDESDAGGPVTLGRDPSKPIRVADADLEIDLDEDNFADLDAQAAAYSKSAPQEEDVQEEVERTRRIAAVNLDWDHVRALHLYRICSSIVSPPPGPSSSKSTSSSIRGKVLKVRVYPSQFGKERMEREEREGPPVELIKKKAAEDEEVDETNIYETGDADEYDVDALRTYQLERLRYYYAIIECDSMQTASHVYNELQGTELERSANVFDLSFVPDDMSFDDDFRDEATAADLADNGYKGLDFVTDALRHSKVKLTWDQDDPERNRVTRRTLTRKEIEENDFRAYIASSSDSEPEESAVATNSKPMERDKLRALLLGGGGNDMPEGWGGADRDEGEDGEGQVDMEVTFMPALSGTKEGDETTLEKYQRKMKEKRKRRKDERKGDGASDNEGESAKDKIAADDFFGESGEEDAIVELSGKNGKDKGKGKKKSKKEADEEKEERRPSTKEELALLVGADSADADPQHFDMKAVLKAEKKKGKKGKRGKKGKGDDDGDNELQEDFEMDIADNRFKALYEDHQFAIDPSNPHFKKTKSMSALLQERSKRSKNKSSETDEVRSQTVDTAGENQSLKSLVESVKRKSAVADSRSGKRQRQ